MPRKTIKGLEEQLEAAHTENKQLRNFNDKLVIMMRNAEEHLGLVINSTFEARDMYARLVQAISEARDVKPSS